MDNSMRNVGYGVHNSTIGILDNSLYEEQEVEDSNTQHEDTGERVNPHGGTLEYQERTEIDERIDLILGIVKYKPSTTLILEEWGSKPSSMNRILYYKNLLLGKEHSTCLNNIVENEVNFLSTKIYRFYPVLNLRKYREGLESSVTNIAKKVVAELILNTKIAFEICKVMTSKAGMISLTEGTTIAEVVDQLDYDLIFMEVARSMLLSIGEKLDYYVMLESRNLRSSEYHFRTHLINCILSKCRWVIEIKTLDILSELLDHSRTSAFLTELIFTKTLGVTMYKKDSNHIYRAYLQYSAIKYSPFYNIKEDIMKLNRSIAKLILKINRAMIDINSREIINPPYCSFSDFIDIFPSAPKIVNNVCVYERVYAYENIDYFKKISVCYYEIMEFVGKSKMLRKKIRGICPEALTLFSKECKTEKYRQLITDIKDAVHNLGKIRENFIISLGNHIVRERPLIIKQSKVKFLADDDFEVVKRNILM